MKTLMTIAAAAIALGAAGSAMALDPQNNIPLEGVAEPVCTLPPTWTVASGNAGAGASQFNGTTWAIPESAMADNTSNGLEYAIRLHGDGFCNTSHSINVRSERGGMVAGDPSAAPPSGFANRRPLKYEAYWWKAGSAGGTTPLGPKAAITASVPLQQATANYVVGPALDPPGSRKFHLRIGMERPNLNKPLIAGIYSDTVTVTLSPVG